MSYTPPIAIILTMIFAVAAVGFLARAVRASSTVGRASDILHVLMGIAMLSMPWSWGAIFPPFLQLFVFGLATLFYLGLLYARPGAAAATDHHSGRGFLIYHAVMMAAMVFMALLMFGSSSGGAMSMPGMDMGSGTSGFTLSSSPLSWSSILTWVFVVVFVAGTLWFLLRLIRPAHHGAGSRLNAVLLTLMSAGMALALLPL